MPNDEPSLKFCLEHLHPRFLVVSAAAFLEVDMIKTIASSSIDTIFRVGGATLGEIEQVVNLHQSAGAPSCCMVLELSYCVEDTNLLQMAALRKIFGVAVGLAEHIDGLSSG